MAKKQKDALLYHPESESYIVVAMSDAWEELEREPLLIDVTNDVNHESTPAAKAARAKGWI